MIHLAMQYYYCVEKINGDSCQSLITINKKKIVFKKIARKTCVYSKINVMGTLCVNSKYRFVHFHVYRL